MVLMTIEDMCEEYPQTSSNFMEGNAIANYTLFDIEDNQFEVCELANDYDIRNMQVLESNCGQCHDLQAEGCIDDALALL